MGQRRGVLFKTIFLAMVGAGLLAAPGGMAGDAADRSGCVACHTDEKALTRTLSREKPKKSALTSGAG